MTDYQTGISENGRMKLKLADVLAMTVTQIHALPLERADDAKMLLAARETGSSAVVELVEKFIGLSDEGRSRVMAHLSEVEAA